MAHNALINGTNYSIKGGNSLINGTGYKVSGGGVLINGTRKNIAFGTPLNNLSVGSSVYMNVSGVRTEFLIVHKGNPDASLYDTSCDGTWLVMKYAYEKRKWNNTNVNEYASSTIHSYLNTTVLGRFDSNIQTTIKQVKIPYRTGGHDGYDLTGANGLSCKIFLLSCREVGLDYDHLAHDGAKLSYFEYGVGYTAVAKRKLGSGTEYWTRTEGGSTIYVQVTFDNGSGGQLPAENDFKVYPALILYSNTLVDANMNIIV